MAYVNPSALQNIQPGRVYPTGQAAQSIQQALAIQQARAQFGALQAGVQVTPNNTSDDPSDWGEMEQMKMFIWFMKMHHEEDIKGFKAMRDIERSVEREEQLERQRQRCELEQNYYASQVVSTRLRQIVDDLPLATIPKKKWWEVWK